MTQELQTSKFGTVTYEAGDVIELIGGMPGFSNLSRFILIENPDLEPIKFLQSLEKPMISFPLIDPRILDPDYQIELGEEERRKLDIVDQCQGLSYSIVTFDPVPEACTVNLFAPIVVNTSNMRALQVILFDSDYSIEQPLLK
ncbi:MAG TPA: flagellar assembly protein FliW [Acidobacteriota bacterium]|nr:flagellar assembly protein FliW [Acidobacteriota bacterium]